MAWIHLSLAALFEVGFALSMKSSHGFTKLWPSVVTCVCIVLGMGFLTLALRTLPVSVAYPVWVGVGAVGTVLGGVLLFGEAFTLAKGLSVAAIAIGVVGLKVSG